MEKMALLTDRQPGFKDLHQYVKPGSVVATDKNVVFVAAGIGDFKAEKIKAFELSTNSPPFKVMKGKKKGSTFSLKGTLYTIQDGFKLGIFYQES